MAKPDRPLGRRPREDPYEVVGEREGLAALDEDPFDEDPTRTGHPGWHHTDPPKGQRSFLSEEADDPRDRELAKRERRLRQRQSKRGWPALFRIQARRRLARSVVAAARAQGDLGDLEEVVQRIMTADDAGLDDALDGIMEERALDALTDPTDGEVLRKRKHRRPGKPCTKQSRGG